MMKLIIDEGLEIRNFKESDIASLAKYANNRKIWRNVRNAFPHPYSEKDAANWINFNLKIKQPSSFAIALNGECIGGIGFKPREDVQIKNLELGYWLGEPFWGKGIMSKAVKSFSEKIFKELDVVRIEAKVYEWNEGSMRVLEKADFEREAILKKRVFKDGHIIDEHIFVRFKV